MLSGRTQRRLSIYKIYISNDAIITCNVYKFWSVHPYMSVGPDTNDELLRIIYYRGDKDATIERNWKDSVDITLFLFFGEDDLIGKS